MKKQFLTNFILYWAEKDLNFIENKYHRVIYNFTFANIFNIKDLNRAFLHNFIFKILQSSNCQTYSYSTIRKIIFEDTKSCMKMTHIERTIASCFYLSPHTVQLKLLEDQIQTKYELSFTTKLLSLIQHNYNIQNTI